MERLIVTEKGISVTSEEKVIPRFHWIHSWTEWKNVRQGEIISHGKTLGYWFEQERHCAVCNKLNIREVRT
jgi:hypothetical protein